MTDVKRAVAILRSMVERWEDENRGSAPDRYDVDRFLEWVDKGAGVHEQASMSQQMHPLAMINEWRKGCSCASLAHPEECQSCTRALIEALHSRLLRFDPPPESAEESAPSADEAIDSQRALLSGALHGPYKLQIGADNKPATNAIGDPLIFSSRAMNPPNAVDAYIVQVKTPAADEYPHHAQGELTVFGTVKLDDGRIIGGSESGIRDALREPVTGRVWPEKCRAKFGDGANFGGFRRDEISPPIHERLSISIEAIRSAQSDFEALDQTCKRLQSEVNARDEELEELRVSVKAAQEALDQLQSPAAEYSSSYSAGMKLCAHVGWIKHELEGLRALKKEATAALDYCDAAIRVREGGGPENLAKSIAVTLAKLDRENRDLREQLKPGDFSELMKRLPNVRAEMPDELARESHEELSRRVLIQCDWLGSYSRSLDGLDLMLDGKPISGSGVESARDPSDIRHIVERMIRVIELKDELIEGLEKDKDRLYGLINTPKIDNFIEAVKLEAAHQRERWGSDHDAGKTDVDWLFLAGYLGGKAVEAGKILEKAVVPDFRAQLTERRLHHIIATGAAILNWHDARSGGDNKMRPGIMPPEERFSEEQVSKAFGLRGESLIASGVKELRAEAELLGVDIASEASVAGEFTIERREDGVDVVKGFVSADEIRHREQES